MHNIYQYFSTKHEIEDKQKLLNQINQKLSTLNPEIYAGLIEELNQKVIVLQNEITELNQKLNSMVEHTL